MAVARLFVLGVAGIAACVLVCGPASATGRVVGGAPISVQSAPWTVAVENRGEAEVDDCTGTILDSQHVLTAAHCVFDSSGNLAPPSQVVVVAGVSNFMSPTSTDAEQQRTASSFTVHPGYTWSQTPGPDDVAVIALSSPLTLGGLVQAVALPAANMAFPTGAAVELAGFGEETAGVNASGALNTLTGTVDPQGTCGPGASIDDDAIKLCASSPTSSTCPGDSGAGLVTTGSTPTLIGVLSAGIPGCPPGSHSVFTFVAPAEILSFVQGNQQPPTAPRETAATTLKLQWSSPLEVGSTLTCATGEWTNTPTSYAYAFENAQTGQVLQQGASGSFVATASTVGDTIDCVGFAINAGGSASLTTVATPAVKPAAVSPTTTGPTKPSQPATPTTPSAPVGSAAAYNAKTIEEKAEAIPSRPAPAASWVGIPQWDGYLRLALLGNQNPYGPMYRDTYVRCWAAASWQQASRPASGASSFSDPAGVLGFYLRGSSWIDVPYPTCVSASIAAKGTITAASAVALATVLHETLVRQGVTRHGADLCLGAVGVWQAVDRHAGSSAATKAFALVEHWYASHLGATAAHSLSACASQIHTVWNG